MAARVVTISHASGAGGDQVGRMVAERLGFRYLAHEEETPGLRDIREHERAAGLDAWPRACMRRSLAPDDLA